MARPEKSRSRWAGCVDSSPKPGETASAQVYYASDLGDRALFGYPFQLAQLLLASGRMERPWGIVGRRWIG